MQLNSLQVYAALAVVFSTIAFIPYWVSAWRVSGKNDTRPSISGIGSWVLSDMAILAAMVANAINTRSAENIAWQMIPYVIGGVVVVVLAFRKNYKIARLNGAESHWSDVFTGWNKLDSTCIGIVALAVAAWGIKSDPDYAIYLSVISVVLGGVAIVIPLWHEPHREPFWPWMLFLIGGGFGVLAVPNWSTSEAIIPGSFFVLQITIVALCSKRYFGVYAHT
jgi:hypothetical protein